jgi:hypothetical protein
VDFNFFKLIKSFQPNPNPPVRNYPCPHCGKGLVNSSRLKYHINRFHSDVAEQPGSSVGAGRRPEEPEIDQGSILQNFISAQNFSDKFSSANLGQISQQQHSMNILNNNLGF